MAIVKWGIGHPNNPRNKENPGRSQQLEEERRKFVGTATKGAIRTKPDGTIMGPTTKTEDFETGSEDGEQTDVDYMSSEEEPDVNMTAKSEEEQEHDNHSTMDDHESPPSPSSVADDTPVSSTKDDLPPGWLPGTLSDGTRFWYTSKRFSGPMLKETPTRVPEKYVFDEGTQRWMIPG